MVFMYRSQDENTDGLHLSITINGTRCIISINYNIVTATLTYQPSSKLYTYRLLQGTHPTSLMTFTVSLARITVSLSTSSMTTCIRIVMTNMSYSSHRHSASSRAGREASACLIAYTGPLTIRAQCTISGKFVSVGDVQLS